MCENCHLLSLCFAQNKIYVLFMILWFAHACLIFFQTLLFLAQCNDQICLGLPPQLPLWCFSHASLVHFEECLRRNLCYFSSLSILPVWHLLSPADVSLPAFSWQNLNVMKLPSLGQRQDSSTHHSVMLIK